MKTCYDGTLSTRKILEEDTDLDTVNQIPQ